MNPLRSSLVSFDNSFVSFEKKRKRKEEKKERRKVTPNHFCLKKVIKVRRYEKKGEAKMFEIQRKEAMIEPNHEFKREKEEEEEKKRKRKKKRKKERGTFHSALLLCCRKNGC